MTTNLKSVRVFDMYDVMSDVIYSDALGSFSIIYIVPMPTVTARIITFKYDISFRWNVIVTQL